LFGLDPCDGSDLNPLGELVDCDKQVGEAPGRFLQRPDEVEAPNSKGPSDGDRLKSLSREVDLPSVELASHIGSDELCGIGYGGGPVEALSEGISY
jgi:hypothetical protein